MFTPQPIGYIRSPYTETSAIPKGLGAKHDAEGVLEILPQFETGLKDVEGFSHLFVLVGLRPFRRLRSGGCDAGRQAAAWRICHAVSAASESHRSHGRRAAVPRRRQASCARRRYARWNANPRHQALYVEYPGREVASRLVGHGRSGAKVGKAHRWSRAARCRTAGSA